MQVGPGERLLAGKYRLIRELGQGGMGAVWYAEHLTLKSPVAIKIISPAIASEPGALARFLREAQAAASLRSPHVVQILDHGVDQGTPYIAMELLEGELLAARLERLGQLSPAETSRFITHIARAVGRAHEAGIVHRDLKPDNVFIVWNDDEEIAKVLDFGVAKANLLGPAGSATTVTGTMLGTPFYMSPEQTEGRDVDHRTDIWALGVIACECLTGQRPFNADTLSRLLIAICERPLPVPSQIGPVPPGFDAWFARACARDLSQRFASAKEAAQALREVCEGRALGATGYAPLARSASGVGHASFDSFGGRSPSASGLSATLEPFDDYGAPRRRRKALLIAAAIGLPLVVALMVVASQVVGRGSAEPAAHATALPSSAVAAAPVAQGAQAAQGTQAAPVVAPAPAPLPVATEELPPTGLLPRAPADDPLTADPAPSDKPVVTLPRRTAPARTRPVAASQPAPRETKPAPARTSATPESPSPRPSQPRTQPTAEEVDLGI